MKNLLAMLAGFLLLLLVEFALYIGGYQTLVGDDPFVGFTGSAPVFLPVAARPGLMSTNPAKLAYFNDQSFSAIKPADSFRVVAFGGSTTYGRPFVDKTSFPTWFGRLLDRYGNGRNIEVINVGGISYASYRVKRVMEEMVNYQPDLFILYSGHNEFLENRTFENLLSESKGLRVLRGILHRSRIYSLLSRSLDRFKLSALSGQTVLGEDVEAIIENVGGPELYHRDDAFRDGVIRQYRANLQLMADLAREHEIPLILCTLPSNLRDLSPFKSENSTGLTSGQYNQFQSYAGEAIAAMRRMDYQVAAIKSRVALQLDGRHAEMNFLYAKALDQMGQFRGAAKNYLQAKNEDIVPLRAIDALNLAVRDSAKANTLPLADVEAVFHQVSPNQIPGNNLFADHVHPTLEGQQLVALVVLETAVDAGLVPLNKGAWQTDRVDARGWMATELEQIPERYQARGWWGVGRLYYWAGKYQEAYEPLQRAWGVIKDKDEIPYQLGQIEMTFDNGERALAYFDAAGKINPDRPLLAVDRAAALDLSGNPEQALALLDGLSPVDGDGLSFASYVRGRAQMHLQQYGAAAQSFSIASEHAPMASSFRLLQAEAWRGAGDKPRAIAAYREYLRLSRQGNAAEAVERWWSAAGSKESLD